MAAGGRGPTARRLQALVLAAAVAAGWASAPGTGVARASEPGGAAPAGVARGPTPAPRDTAAAIAPGPLLAAVDAGSSGFTVRRVFNPSYRPPRMGVSPAVPGATRTLQALDHLRAHVAHLATGGAAGQLLWEISAGEEGRNERAVQLDALGMQRGGASTLRTLTLSGRRGPLLGSVGDPDAERLSPSAVFQQLRGAVLRFEPGGQPRALALGGVSRPVPGMAVPRLALGGVAVREVPWGGAAVSATLFGAARGRPPTALARVSGSDTLAGRGLFGTVGWRVPLGLGRFSQRVGVQAHDLDGAHAIGVENGLAWTLQTPALVVSLSSERASEAARTLGTDRLGRAPRREDRWSLQDRFARGRAEAHLNGIVREGGDSTLAARSVQVGGSGGLGRSPWYGGLDAVWGRRGVTGLDEQRQAVYVGGTLAPGDAVLARVERSRLAGGSEALTALTEASLALPRGMRLALEPRATWGEGVFDRADFTARLSAPTAWLSSRLTASLTVGAEREGGFRGAVREGSLAVSLAPGQGDRGDLEVRRLDQGGRPALESDVAYEARHERYGVPGGWHARFDTARVTVRVTRSGNGSGVGDVLVSLDGGELRFTDADGVAWFDGVAPGIYVVGIEERSLPAGWQVITTSRVFVTVERGRITDVVEFRVARPERRTEF